MVGSQCVEQFQDHFDKIIGIENNFRKEFFGEQASVKGNLQRISGKFENHEIDIREFDDLKNLFQRYHKDIRLVVHAAAQPSHDWGSQNPLIDFSINATGTLNLLELTRRHCPEAVFIFLSTNKVYGDAVNKLGFIETDTRFELPEDHLYFNGLHEGVSIDSSLHSIFGVSKTSADLMTQEYGRYYGLKTATFRCGCITGAQHQGVSQHGFLSYLARCLMTDTHYSITGFKGKQVRDNIHAFDLVSAFLHFYKNPRVGQVYNMGGGRHSNCSVLEAIEILERKTSKKLKYSILDKTRIGDHKWWISDVSKFKLHYPAWQYQFNMEGILEELVNETSN